MYNVLSDEFLNENYPILNCEDDTILFFISKDGVSLHSVFLAIKSKYKNIENTIKKNYIIKEIEENKIKKNDELNNELEATLILSKISNGKKILIMTTQSSWKTGFEESYVEKGFEKISAVYKERGIKSIAIQEGIVSTEFIDKLVDKLDLPKITYYQNKE